MKRALLLLAAVVVAGCGKADVPTGGSVTVTVSQDFGSSRLAPTKQTSAARQETVMTLLEKNFEVTSSGNAVEEIGGVAGGEDGGKPVGWYYFVNGIAGEQGASQRKLYAGDRIWWDRHSRVRVPAVVGAFPEPFRSGLDGKKLPIRLVCLGAAEDRSCDEVETRLKEAGINGLARSNLESSPGEVVRILVGKWSDMRRDIAARTLEQGPSVSGVFARPDATGTKIELLDAAGDVGRTLGAASGLVAATRYKDDRPTWMITGTDDVGVAAAAAAISEEMLANRFALAIEGGRGVALPLQTP